MMKDITLGQFIPGDSVIHKLDPRVKIVAILIYMISVFLVKKFIVYLPIGAALLAVILISGIQLKFVLKGLKPLIFIIFLTLMINLLMTPGRVLYEFGFIRLTEEGLRTGLFMATRLILLVVGTSLLTLTTSPIILTDGMESLMKPLTKIGFPSHQLAMMMTIALRFIPTLFEETDKIMKAQMARGADFESGNLLKRAKNLVPLLVPLFINSFRRADELATAMESRCYRGGEGRTRLNELNYEKRDYGAYIMLALYLAFIVGMRFL
ncbi:MAG: energy-coupling factor transporter transmembrane component T [Gallicola sp.]|nr:energy-coupling factor transporter transmembrane component T [Gallicola sp.]